MWLASVKQQKYSAKHAEVHVDTRHRYACLGARPDRAAPPPHKLVNGLVSAYTYSKFPLNESMVLMREGYIDEFA